MDNFPDHEKSAPVLRTKCGLELIGRVFRIDPSTIEFTPQKFEHLPTIHSMQRVKERSRAFTPSTSTSSLDTSLVAPDQSNRALTMQKTLSFPPYITAQTWAITDGDTGALLWGSMESERREIASLTKIMTCFLSLKLVKSDPSLSLEAILPVSRAAASMIGTTANLKEGDELHLLDVLYGLMLPSGNDAAYCLAEFFGKYLAEHNAGIDLPKSPVAVFVREMNKTARELGLDNTTYANPHGLPNVKNRSCAVDVGMLATIAMRDPLFAEIVNTRTYSCYVLQSSQACAYRKLKWTNTNRLLERGWDGVKTGITNVAGPCLCASSRRGTVHIIVTVLGSKSMDRRWQEVPKLGKWAFSKLSAESRCSFLC